MQTGRSHFVRYSLRVQIVSVIVMFLVGLILGHLDANNKAMWCREFIKTGNRLYAMEDNGTAKLAYDAALQYEPGNAIAKNNLGVVLYELSRNQEASSAMTEASRLDPKNAIAHYVGARSLLQLKRYDEALKQAKIAVRLAPTDPIAYETLHLAASAADDPRTAGDAYAKWCQITGNTTAIKEHRIIIAY